MRISDFHGVWFITGIVLTICDHAIKHGLTAYANPDSYSVNTGIALSMFAQNGKIALLLSVCALLMIGYVLWRGEFGLNADETRILSVIFIAGAGNAVDRFIWGGIIDYIPFFGLFTFNLSDIVISVGVALLLFGIFSRKTAVRF